MIRQPAEKAPHSWDLEHWPPHVYPHSENRARYLLRANRDELIAAGVLSRVGREIIVIGERYSRWLEKNTVNVPGFVCPANTRPMGRASS